MQKYLFTFLVFVSFTAFAQNTIEATIKDEANKPIAFANIYLPDSKKSTVSNEDGRFYLIINSDIDKSVIISHLSYQDAQFTINDNFPETIILKEGALQLDEVVIGKQITGEEIALKVIENLKNNHGNAPTYYEYFRRVIDYNKNNNEVDLVQEYYGKLVHTLANKTKVNIKKSRAVTYTLNGEKELERLMMHDFFKIESDNFLLYKRQFLKKGQLKNYTINIEGSTIFNTTECYILKYTKNDGGNYDPDAKILAYIDKTSYGIVKLITGSYSTDTNYYQEKNFINIDNKWVLSSASDKFKNKLYLTLYNHINDEKDFINEDYKALVIGLGERLKKHNKNPNDSFWDNYQHIPLLD